MIKIKNKNFLSIFFISLMIVGIVSYGTNIVKAIDEDGYEENDDFLTAYEIGPGFYPNLCHGDEDWFNISIGADEIIKIYLEFNGSIDNIDLQLYNSAHQLLTSSNGIGNNESVLWTSMTPQTLYIRVYGDHSGEAYNMTVSIDDWAEPNNIRAESVYLGLGYHENFIQNDDDWYNYGWVYSMETLEVDLYYDTAFVLNISLIDEYDLPHGYTLTYESWGTRLEWLSAGDHSDVYIHVYGSDIGLEYNLSLYIFGGSDDWAEENDYLTEARHLDLLWNGGMVQNDDDWYEVWLYPYDKLELNLFYNTWETWMNLDLFDEYENFLTSGYMDGDHLHLFWENDEYDRNVYIKITGNNSGYFYDLELIFNGQTGDDWAEDNDYFYDAEHLDFGYYDDFIQNDDDWYEVWLKPNDQLKIKLFYDTGYTWMNLELYGENEVFLKSGISEEDHVFLSWTNDNDYGISFYIKISGPNNGDWYHLDLIVNGDDGDDGNDGDDSKDENNEDDPFANIDFSSIPGFPLEFVGTVFILSTFAVIFFVKKKKN